MILNIIKALENATKLSVKPFSTDKIEDCIVYKYYSTADNGAVANKRLELRLITSSLQDAETYRKQIIQTLVNVGDESKIDGILNCELNGGGSEKEFATNTIHTLMYFDLILRSEQ